MHAKRITSSGDTRGSQTQRVAINISGINQQHVMQVPPDTASSNNTSSYTTRLQRLSQASAAGVWRQRLKLTRLTRECSLAAAPRTLSSELRLFVRSFDSSDGYTISFNSSTTRSHDDVSKRQIRRPELYHVSDEERENNSERAE